MLDNNDSCCAWINWAALSVLVTISLAALVHIYRHWVPPSYRIAVWWLASIVLVACSLFNNEVRDFTAAFGTLAAVLVVVWKDQVLNVLNPASVGFDGIPKLDPDPQWPGECLKLDPNGTNNDHIKKARFTQYHLRVKNLNPGRILESASVVFNKFEIDGEIKEVVVARQFTWAPHECEQRYAFLPDHKVLDMFYYSPQFGLCLIIYSGLGYTGGEVAFNCMSGKQFRFFLEIRASNLPNPERYVLNVSMADGSDELQFRLENEKSFV